LLSLYPPTTRQFRRVNRRVEHEIRPRSALKVVLSR
jgi:hypothetical protein